MIPLSTTTPGARPAVSLFTTIALAAAFAGAATAQTSSTCIGPQVRFDNSWSNGSYSVGGQQPQWFNFSEANWDVACIDNQTDIPAIWNNSCWIGCRELDFWMKGRGNANDDDSIGFVLGYCAGDATDPNAEYLAVIWNRSSQVRQMPGCSPVAGASPMGMKLVRVFGTPDAQEFWEQSNLNLPCSGPTSGVEQLASAMTRGNTAWPRFVPQNFRVLMDRNNLKIWCNGTLEFDVQGDFFSYSRGCFGYFTQGAYVDFWNLHSTSVGAVTASSNNYGVGTPGCLGVPALTMLNRPVNGSSPQIHIGNPGNTLETGAMVWSLAPDNFLHPFLGGNLLVAQPFAAVTTQQVPPGGYTFVCTILDDSCQNGQEFYLQWICPDQCAPNGWAMSQGLRIVLGDL